MAIIADAEGRIFAKCDESATAASDSFHLTYPSILYRPFPIGSTSARPKPITAEMFCRISDQIFCGNLILFGKYYSNVSAHGVAPRFPILSHSCNLNYVLLKVIFFALAVILLTNGNYASPDMAVSKRGWLPPFPSAFNRPETSTPRTQSGRQTKAVATGN